MPRRGRISSRPSSRRARSARRTVLVLTPITAARWRAGGSLSPGFASPSAIARRISAATCSCRCAGSSRSMLTPSNVPSRVAHYVAVQTPPAPRSTPDPGIEDGVIEDARARQRRYRRIGWALAAAVVSAGALIAGLVGGGGGAGRHANGQPSNSPPFPPATGSTVVPKLPGALAVGPNGELYVADAGREQILRRLPDGRFVVVAGTGSAGYTGDGGRATRAEVEPGSLAIGPNGVLYFVQTGRTTTPSGLMSSVVREVAPNGRITTVIGQDPNCAVVPGNSISLPAKSAEFSGA